MELQRGICSLCSESGKVFTSSNAFEFLKYLPRILVENFLTEAQFQQIKDSLKVCSICCYKLELISDLKNNMKNPENSDISDSLDIHCYFCNSTKCVMKVKDDWNFFIQRTEGFLKLTDYPVDICYRCMFYFDTIFNFKTKLSYKFPQLAVYTKPPKKQNETPKRKSLSNSPQSSKKRKIFDNCFTYLQPLCNENYHIDAKIISDAKMYKKIAYVNLRNMNNFQKVTPKVRPQIKIKLKTSSKKAQREKYQKKNAEALKEHSIISQPYVKLCKSEEIPIRINNNKEKRRSLSIERENEPSEEKIDETPKAPTTTNLAPKRRVSLYVDLSNAEVENEETENKSDADKETINPEEINHIVAKYIKDTTFNDTSKLELLQEIEDNNPKVSTENVDEDKIENTIEKSVEENGIMEEDKQEENNVDSNNYSEPQSEELQKEEESFEIVDIPDSPPSTLSVESSNKKSECSGNSDLDENEKIKDSSNVENDSLNGSERKKKRVTFSADTSFSNE